MWYAVICSTMCVVTEVAIHVLSKFTCLLYATYEDVCVSSGVTDIVVVQAACVSYCRGGMR